jgi:hypothetical protein
MGVFADLSTQEHTTTQGKAASRCSSHTTHLLVLLVHRQFSVFRNGGAFGRKPASPTSGKMWCIPVALINTPRFKEAQASDTKRLASCRPFEKLFRVRNTINGNVACPLHHLLPGQLIITLSRLTPHQFSTVVDYLQLIASHRITWHD